MVFPDLKDWRATLEKRISNLGQSQEDLLLVVHTCEELLQNMQPAATFIDKQKADISTWLSRYQELYFARFNERPPSRPIEDIAEHLLLDTPEKRKSAVRETAIALAEPGMEVGDKDVRNALAEKGMRLVANNPAAAISTILNGYVSEFQKVTGKSGIFERRIPEKDLE